MPRRALLTLVTLACTLLVSGLVAGCTTTYIDSSNGTKDPVVTLGWKKIDPVAIDLPTDHPLGSPATPDLTGPLVVNIWASYCGPCTKELPLLEKVANTGRIHVVGFSRDIQADKALGKLAAAGVTYPNWLDTEASIALALDGRVPINAVPSSVLIRDGKVVAVHIGEFKTEKDVLEGLQQ